MNDYEYSQGQQDESKHKLGKQCDMLLNNIDLKQPRNRQWVSKCYRHLNQLITQSSKTKFKQIAYQTIAANSHRSPPSMHSQSNPMNSTKAYRHLQNKLSSHMQASENANYQQYTNPPTHSGKQCKLSTAPYRSDKTIASRYEYKPNKIAPLSSHMRTITHLESNPNTIHTFKKHCQRSHRQEQSYIIDGPNGEVRTQTVPFKLPSNPLKIQIKRSNSKDGNVNYLIRGLGDQNHMVRPQETFDHGLSSSQGSYIYPFIGIDTESRSRD